MSDRRRCRCGSCERRSADPALGVAVDGPVARLALLDTGNGAHGVIDESVVDLAEDPIARLTETVVGTSRSLADQYHRLVATRLCWSDQHRANQLRQVLETPALQNVAVLSDSEAATAMSSLPLAVPDDPDLAIARGAALDAATGRLSYPAGDATALAPVPPTGRFFSPGGDPTMASAAAPMTEAIPGAEDATRAAAMESGPQLAYSMEDDDSELLPLANNAKTSVGPRLAVCTSATMTRLLCSSAKTIGPQHFASTSRCWRRTTR
jgi:hypothetical protein